MPLIYVWKYIRRSLISKQELNCFTNFQPNMHLYTLEEVFGTSRTIPLNYIERDGVDNIFKEGLLRQKHIVIYGSSKQGKTCLRKKHIDDEKLITIVCLNSWTIAQLNEQILKQAGFEINLSNSQSSQHSDSSEGESGLNYFLSLKSKVIAESKIESIRHTKPLEMRL